MNGRSKEILVFLHGFGGGSSAYKWSKVYPVFVAKYQIVAPDLIGWGRSGLFARYYCPHWSRGLTSRRSR